MVSTCRAVVIWVSLCTGSLSRAVRLDLRGLAVCLRFRSSRKDKDSLGDLFKLKRSETILWEIYLNSMS